MRQEQEFLIELGKTEVTLVTAYDRVVRVIAGAVPRGFALLFLRVAVAGIFWRSGRTKIVDGAWFEISDTTYFLFENEYAGVPLPSDFAAVAATIAEHAFPILLVFGILTRLSALGLLGMTMVIQIFVYPEAWWTMHMLWAAMLLMLIMQGGGLISADHLLSQKRVS